MYIYIFVRNNKRIICKSMGLEVYIRMCTKLGPRVSAGPG